MKLISYLHPYRYKLFLISLLFILFGSLVMPGNIFEYWVSPVLLIMNLMAGIVLTSEKRGVMRFLIVLVVINSIMFFDITFNLHFTDGITFIKLLSYFVFYGLVTYQIMNYVFLSKKVTGDVILGIICGYLSLGLLSFFLFYIIEYFEPNSYSNIVFSPDSIEVAKEQLMYFSYVTLLTIGYGEIVPLSEVAQKGAILVALMGQFYIAILTAIVVGKFINQAQLSEED